MATIAMKNIVKDSNVQMVHSSAHQGIALSLFSVVMEILTVMICLMKKLVLHGFQMVDSVQKQNFNVQIHSVSLHQIYVVS